MLIATQLGSGKAPAGCVGDLPKHTDSLLRVAHSSCNGVLLWSEVGMSHVSFAGMGTLNDSL